MALYPLCFQPKFVPKIWGGRKIESVLGKKLPTGQIGESWELYDFPPGVVDGSKDWTSATVINGPLAGRSLHSLVTEFRTELLGDVPTAAAGQFPILIKFLDAREDLSVQVHPDQAYADANPDAHLKSEAWYVLQSDPGSRLLKGLTPGTTREKFASAVAAGTSESLIEAITVKPGDCHYLPSGTVHALGAGILVAEVQTPSDTTFRVHDFNRIDAGTGKPRQLHVEQAMQCISFDPPEANETARSHVAGPHATVSRLVTSPYFTLEKVRFREGATQTVPGGQPTVWIMLEGSAKLSVDDLKEQTTVTAGQTVLLPAKMKNPKLTTLTDCVWLEVTFPVA